MNKTAATLTSSANQRWATPRDLFARVQTTMTDAGYPIVLDAAAEARSRVVESYLGPDHEHPDRRDALNDIAWSYWMPEHTGWWLNSPYGTDIPRFVLRAGREGTRRPGVALWPSRLGAKWFLQVRRTAVHVEYIVGSRLSFLDPETMEPPRNAKGEPMPATSQHILATFWPERERWVPDGGLCPMYPIDLDLNRLD